MEEENGNGHEEWHGGERRRDRRRSRVQRVAVTASLGLPLAILLIVWFRPELEARQIGRAHV